MGAINSLRHFSNHITILRALDKDKNLDLSNLENLRFDSLFNAMSIYIDHIRVELNNSEQYLKNDIAYLTNLTIKNHKIDITKDINIDILNNNKIIMC